MENTFTKKQRNSIYRKAYLVIEKEKEHCICWSMVLSSKKARYEYDHSHYLVTKFCLNYFPELNYFKPKGNIEGYWFESFEKGKRQRLTALAFMIAMTE